MKEKNSTYSITKLITHFLLLLLIATFLLSVFYFIYFASENYKKSVEYFQQITDESSRTIGLRIESAIRQLQTIVAEACNSSFWTEENQYLRMQQAEAIENSVAGAMVISDLPDSIVLFSRRSDEIIQSHTMDEDSFADFISKYNKYNKIIPSSGLFGDGIPSHIVVSLSITQRSAKTRLTQTVGTANMTIPIEPLLATATASEHRMLCIQMNGKFLVCASYGVDDSITNSLRSGELDLFDFRNGIADFSGNKIILREVPYSDLYLLTTVKNSELKAQLLLIIFLGLASFSIIILLAIRGIRFINSRIHKPINSLIADVQTISTHDKGYRLEKGRSKEISEISDSINKLLGELEIRNENLKELHLLNRESQLLALQSQINPHFLYNTLECIRSLSQGEDSDAVSEILDPMIAIYRYSASNNSQGTVCSELECTRNYAKIITIRFAERIGFEFQIDHATLSARIPRMVIQPLVENAINHAYSNTLDSVSVEIRTVLDGSDVVISVIDHGCGISQEKLDSLLKRMNSEKLENNDGNHVGLRNVHQRIRREYGEKYGLSIESELGKGSSVRIRIPFLEDMK